MKKLTDFLGIPEREEENEDWTFAGEDTKYLTHGFHPYPARMMPLIAKKVIERFTTNDDVILDPFCGSGTVLVEAIVHNRNAIGFDINPLATLIAKVKTTPLEPNLLEKKIKEVLERISCDKSQYPEPKGIQNLHYWFKPKVIEELSKILHHIQDIENEEVRNFFAVAFSYCVWKVSNIKKGEYKLYRMSEKELAKWNPDVLLVFSRILYDNLESMRKFYGVMQGKNAKANVYLMDVRESTLEREATLILTSPPYGDSRTTVAYGQFSRYPALWLGIKDVVNVDEKSLGGIRKKGNVSKLGSKTLEEVFNRIYEKDPERAWDLYSFFYDMDIALLKLSKALKEGRSHMTFVIGNRIMRRIRIPTDKILIEMAEKHGFKHERTFYRRIPTKRIPWKNAPENIPGAKSETISSEAIIIWKY
ncbi:MAG: DNA methyltransferase [Thermoprotei archaeon]|jgi:site-specific DNA-adenine methylase